MLPIRGAEPWLRSRHPLRHPENHLTKSLARFREDPGSLRDGRGAPRRPHLQARPPRPRAEAWITASGQRPPSRLGVRGARPPVSNRADDLVWRVFRNVMGGTAQDDGSVVGKSAFPAKSLRFSEGLIAVAPPDQTWQGRKLG